MIFVVELIRNEMEVKMDRKAVEKRVLKVFSDVMPEVDIDSIDMTAELSKEYGVDSVSIIQLIVELEKEFGAEFEDTELALGLYYDMNDVVAAVAAKLN
jgi:acyl carrier protein